MADYINRYQREELLAVIRAQGRLQQDLVQEVDLSGLHRDEFCVQESTLRNASLAEAVLPASRWEESLLQGASLRKAELRGSVFEACVLLLRFSRRKFAPELGGPSLG